MTPEQTLAFLGFAVVMAGTPGPSNALLTTTAANVGVVRGLSALAGVAAGMASMMFLVVIGLGTLILHTPLLVTAVKWLGAAVLLWFAWKIGTSGESADHAGRPIGFLGAAAFQWVNPKSWLACTSAAATFVGQGSAFSQAVTLALLFVLAAVPACFVWLAFGAVVQNALRSAKARRRFNVVMAILLAASVLLLVV